MLKIIICEDDEKALVKTTNIINRVIGPKDIDYRTLKFNCFDKKLQEEINNPNDQKIYILDVELPEISGLEIASKIRENDWDSLIIFVTVHNEFKSDVFYSRLMVLDYICKQITYEERLEKTFKFALDIIDQKKVFIFKSNRTTYRIPYKDIIYVEKVPMNNKCLVITNDNSEFEITMPLQDIFKQLKEPFYQTHQSCIINLDNVKKIDYKENTIKFNNGDEIYYLANRHKKGLKEYVANR